MYMKRLVLHIQQINVLFPCKAFNTIYLYSIDKLIRSLFAGTDIYKMDAQVKYMQQVKKLHKSSTYSKQRDYTVFQVKELQKG